MATPRGDGAAAASVLRSARRFERSEDAGTMAASPRENGLRPALAKQAAGAARDGRAGAAEHVPHPPATMRNQGPAFGRWTEPTGAARAKLPPPPTLVERVRMLLTFNARLKEGVRETEAAALGDAASRERFWAAASTVRRDPQAPVMRLDVVSDDPRAKSRDGDGDGSRNGNIADFLVPSPWERARCFRHTAHFVERLRSDLRRGQSAGKVLNQLAKVAALSEAQLTAAEAIFIALRDGGVDGPLCTRTSANLLAAAALLVEVNRVDVLTDNELGNPLNIIQRKEMEGKQTNVVNLPPSDARVIASFETRPHYVFTDAERVVLDTSGRVTMALAPMLQNPPEGRYGERHWVDALNSSGTERQNAVDEARRRRERYVGPRDVQSQTAPLDGMAHDSLSLSARRAVERHPEIRKLARSMQSALHDEDAEAVESLVHECIEAAGRLVGADRASVWLMMANGREIYTHALTGIVSSSSGAGTGGSDADGANVRQSRVLRLPLYRGDGEPNGLVGECCTTGTPMLIADAREHRLFNSAVDRSSGYVTKAVACHPLISVTSIGLDVLTRGSDEEDDATGLRGKVQCIGAIQVVNKRPSPLGYTEFTPRDLDVLAAFSIIVASAVNGSRVLMQRKLLHGFALATSSLGPGAERPGENVVLATRRVVQELGNLLGADRTSLFLVDMQKRCLWAPLTGGKVDGMSTIVVPLVEDGAWCDPKERTNSPTRGKETPKLAAKSRKRAHQTEAERLKKELMRAKELRRGLAAHCVNDGETILVDDAQLDDRFNRSVDEQTGYSTRSLLCVPLRRSGSKQTFGVVQFVNKCRSLLGGPVFTSDDASVAEAISATAATVLERAELREKMNSQISSYADIMASVSAMAESELTKTSDGGSVGGVRSLLVAIARQLRKVLKCARVSVFLIESTPNGGRLLKKAAGSGWLEDPEAALEYDLSIMTMAGGVTRSASAVGDGETGLHAKVNAESSGSVISNVGRLGGGGGKKKKGADSGSPVAASKSGNAAAPEALGNPAEDKLQLRGSVNVATYNDGRVVEGQPIKRRDSLDAASSESVVLPGNIGLLAEALRRERPINVKDCYKDSRFDPTVDAISGYVTVSALTIPLSTRMGSQIGVLQAINKHAQASVLDNTTEAAAAAGKSGEDDDMMNELFAGKRRIAQATIDRHRRAYVEFSKEDEEKAQTLCTVASTLLENYILMLEQNFNATNEADEDELKDDVTATPSGAEKSAQELETMDEEEEEEEEAAASGLDAAEGASNDATVVA